MTQRYKTRRPELKTREVEPEVKQERKPRRYIPASMPVVCPDCGHTTRMADGRHVDPVRKTILEYRTCAKCGLKLAAGRIMTQRESESYCTHQEAVAEYEQTVD
jgi:C4-type Zn-finger protein